MRFATQKETAWEKFDPYRCGSKLSGSLAARSFATGFNHCGINFMMAVFSWSEKAATSVPNW
jgi:hypothetical protein